MERASVAETAVTRRAPAIEIVVDKSSGEIMPTDKIVDVTPQALRMSSPFNSHYWLAAA